ncbi:MAG: molybdopterin biosynthesis protein [Christensenellales bacterium]
MKDTQRKTYIENNDEQLSLSLYLESLGNLSPATERVRTKDALGRITACPVFAKVCDPCYNAAAMDGIAVYSKNTEQASEKHPLFIPDNEFRYINTGNEMPKDTDCVIMIEDVMQVPGGVSITSPAHAWQNVRTVGESIVAGEMLLASRHKLRPVDLAALIASGNVEVEVIKAPLVGVIPTGSEMIDDPGQLTRGKIMESNSKMFSGLIEECGGKAAVYPVAADDIDSLIQAIERSIPDCDMLLINAGSSAGTKDYTFKAIEKLGRVVVHGIAIKPGKPTVLGIIQGKPVIGLPGYPVSAYLAFRLFAMPLLCALSCFKPPATEQAQAVLTKRVTSALKSTEYLRMSVGAVGDRLVATPLERAASAIMSLVRADGILKIPQNLEGIESGETVNINLLKPLEEIKKTLVIIGSHDLIIDLISERMRITSAHIGSMGGLFTLARKESHLAPIHLLDEQSGEYNTSYAKKYIKEDAVLIKGVGRTQGFITRKGECAHDFSQIAQNKLRFANRQRGAGTRILTDYILKKEGISSEQILGYDKEFTTHLAVASAVKNNVADIGVGVLSAAIALDMDFYPFAEEEYDFLTTKDNLELPLVQEFISVLKSNALKANLERLGGYTFNRIGEIEYIK